MIYDYIIVGGGSAGSVLANRLSARSANKVLVCEAGQDTPHGKVPKEISDSYPGTAYLDKRFIWNELKVTTQVVSHNNPEQDRPPLRKYEQARVLGGGSSINGQMANRGAPTDFAEWEERGAEGWGWDKVLPYFKKVEHDLDFDDEYHGREGHIPVRRIMPDLWGPHPNAAAAAFKAAGYDYLPDQNGEFRDGYFPVTISNAFETRVSAAVGYLGPGVRLRDNLTVSTETSVKELLFEGNKCVGVKATVKGKEQEFRGNEVILSSGAIHSPAHLLRAGIGPAIDLQDLGIEVRQHLAGVGQRLMDHPSIALAAFLKAIGRGNPHTGRHMFVGLRYSSGLPEVPAGDMFVVVTNRSAWHAVGKQIASLLLFVNKTYSETGQVTLNSRHWADEPNVEFNLLSDRRDLDRLMSGFRHMAELQMSPELQAVVSNSFPASYGEKVRQVGEVTKKNAILTSIFARMLDGPAAFREVLMKTFVQDKYSLGDVLEDQEKLEAWVREAAVGVWHASCTCRMGRHDDPMSVTDNTGRVHGMAGLRVVDASVFPVVPCANTNFPTMMVAEKIADAILEGR